LKKGDSGQSSLFSLHGHQARLATLAAMAVAKLRTDALDRHQGHGKTAIRAGVAACASKSCSFQG
jgi:hypothetical protein